MIGGDATGLAGYAKVAANFNTVTAEASRAARPRRAERRLCAGRQPADEEIRPGEIRLRPYRRRAAQMGGGQSQCGLSHADDDGGISRGADGGRSAVALRLRAGGRGRAGDRGRQPRPGAEGAAAPCGCARIRHSFNYDNQEGDGLQTGISTFADELWREAGVRPDDIDVASIYDDYPTMVLAQLNDLGMIPGNDIASSAATEIGERRLPINTWGGMLSAGQPGGHAGGMNGISEAVLQLQHRAGARQVKDARACGRHRLRHDDVPLRRHRGCGSSGARRMSEGVTIWRCAKCGDRVFSRSRCSARAAMAMQFETDRVIEGVVEEISVIRHMLGQENWQPRRIASVRTSDGQSMTVGLRDEVRAWGESRTVPGRRGAVRAREGCIAMSGYDYRPFCRRRGTSKIAGPTARAHTEARTKKNPRAQGMFAQLGADAQRAVPRHHDRRPGHSGALRAAAGGRADAGDDRGGQRAACRSCRPEQKKASMLSGRFQSVAALAEHRALSSKTTACASTRSAQPLRDAVDGGAARQHEQRGYELSRDVMRLNRFLGDLVGGPEVMGEWSYTFCLFGEPSASEPWGWQFFGHHLVLNCFVLGEQMVLTPAFWGAEPNYADHGPFKGIHLFQDEERAGLTLMRRSQPSSRAARSSTHSMMGGDLPEGRRHFADNLHLGGAFQDNRVVPYEGLRGTELTALQRRNLIDLVREVSVSAAGRSARRAHGRGRAAHGETHFCWIGGFSEESPFYYRVQSPVAFIEFDHHAGVFLTNPEPAKFHVHTIVRTPNGNDYGFDLLRQHYKTAPHHRHSHHHGDGDRHHHHGDGDHHHHHDDK